VSIRQNLRYLGYITVHKLYVGLACAREGIYWRGLTHDLSKFRPSEWGPYRAYFYGDKGDENREANKGGKPDETGDRPFDIAWLKHIHRNPHHWQYFLLRKDDGSTVPMPMSEGAMVEMLCDWYGAGAAIHGDASWSRTWGWYQANADKMVLHPMTRARVVAFLFTRAGVEMGGNL